MKNNTLPEGKEFRWFHVSFFQTYDGNWNKSLIGPTWQSNSHSKCSYLTPFFFVKSKTHRNNRGTSNRERKNSSVHVLVATLFSWLIFKGSSNMCICTCAYAFTFSFVFTENQASCLRIDTCSAVNKFWSRRLHWESRLQPTFRALKTRAS